MAAFIIGVPKEGERYPGIAERRVALTPGGVREIAPLGAKVLVEKGAGQASGFSDTDYLAAGAEVVYSRNEVLSRADMVLKMSLPKAEEIRMITPGKSLWGYLHLAVASAEILQAIQEQKINALGFEIITTAAGTKPVLKISSEITGKMAPQIASRLLQAPPGLGMLLSSIPGIPPADVVILGAGVLGSFAAMSFLNFGSLVYVLDTDRDKLEELYTLSSGRIVTAMATAENIEKFVTFAEVLVSAVLLPGEWAPQLVTDQTLGRMRRGSVIIDFSIDQGGTIETTRRKGPQSDFYIENGLIFYSLPNVASLVPRTASHALTYAVLPYLRTLLQKGWEGALASEVALQKGLYFYKGQAVRKALQDKCPVKSLDEILAK